MIFKTTIYDADDNQWNIKASLSGKMPVYESYPEIRQGWYAEDFAISDIIMEKDGIKHEYKSLALMPDAFNQEQIKWFEEDAYVAFCEDWIDCQNKASDASYETFISQKLA